MPREPRKFEWDCKQKGCFNAKMRLDFISFSGCFPKGFSFTDIDGAIEVEGNFLMLEGKSRREHNKHGIRISKGQRIMFQQLSKRLGAGSVVYLIEIEAEKMKVFGFQKICNGQMGEFTKGDIETLKQKIKEWADWAGENPAV